MASPVGVSAESRGGWRMRMEGLGGGDPGILGCACWCLRNIDPSGVGSRVLTDWQGVVKVS